MVRNNLVWHPHFANGLWTRCGRWPSSMLFGADRFLRPPEGHPSTFSLPSHLQGNVEINTVTATRRHRARRRGDWRRDLRAAGFAPPTFTRSRRLHASSNLVAQAAQQRCATTPFCCWQHPPPPRRRSAPTARTGRCRAVAS